MRFSGYGLGASYLATHNHSAVIPEVTLKSNSGSVHFHLSDPHGVSSKKSVKNAIRLVHKSLSIFGCVRATILGGGARGRWVCVAAFFFSSCTIPLRAFRAHGCSGAWGWGGQRP
jgi:hypothetical protein